MARFCNKNAVVKTLLLTIYKAVVVALNVKVVGLAPLFESNKCDLKVGGHDAK
jgi:hypothetical protein